jgi:hypothetical protein
MDPRAAYLHAQRLQMMQGQSHPHHMHPGMSPHPGFGAPPGAAGQAKGDDQEVVARNLLNLKTDGPGEGGPTEEEFRMQAQRQAALMRGGGGMYAPPSVGQVYGYPTVSAFDRHMIAAAVNRDNHRTHAPALMEEPQVSLTDVSFDDLIGESTLVVKKDRDLVPDALFVCMAQMKPCKLTPADRVGCYKAREIGFVGMCCKHCGGQPGFGRYFPNSVRSLAQTTTSQTILKHISGKCRFCPPTIRKAVLELQRQQAHKEGLATGRPRYGSRKIFFQRMWARLHGKKGAEEAEDDDVLKDAADGDEGACDTNKDGGDGEKQEVSGEEAGNETTDAVKDEIAEANQSPTNDKEDQTAEV